MWCCIARPALISQSLTRWKEQRRIFELINETKNKAIQIRSPEIHLLMEKILEEWSAQVQSAYQVVASCVRETLVSMILKCEPLEHSTTRSFLKTL